MPEVRILLHARERLLSAARSHRVWFYGRGFFRNVALALLCVGNPECCRNADGNDCRRDRVRRVVYSILEGPLAGPGPQAESAILGGL